MRHRNIPWWKKALSYFMEVKLAQASTAVTDDLTLGIKYGRLYLFTSTAIYSYEDLYTSFKTGLDHIADKIPKFESVLNLGFGLGSIAWMLRDLYDFDGEITGVEIDPWIVEQFGKYYEYDNIHLVTKDATLFLKEQTDTYDLICIDLFEDESIPPQFQEEEFFEMVWNALNPGGYIIYNKLPAEGENFSPDSALARALNSVFPNNRMIPAQSNRLMIGIKEE